MDKTIIRTAKEKDAERLLEIYAPYVTDTAIVWLAALCNVATSSAAGMIWCGWRNILANIPKRWSLCVFNHNVGRKSKSLIPRFFYLFHVISNSISPSFHFLFLPYNPVITNHRIGYYLDTTALVVIHDACCMQERKAQQ